MSKVRLAVRFLAIGEPTKASEVGECRVNCSVFGSLRSPRLS